MSVSTVYPTTNEFCFPLRPDNNNDNNTENNSDSPTKRGPISHSRQYTGIELPLPVGKEDLSHEPQNFSTSTSPPTEQISSSNDNATLGPPKSPHRRHAHKRSGAVSAHDIKGLDLDLAPPPALGSPFTSTTSSPKRSNSTKTASNRDNDPLTCPSSSSLPNTFSGMDDENSPTSYSSSSPSRPKVSFASSPVTVIDNNNDNDNNQETIITSSPQTNEKTLGSTPSPEISVTPPETDSNNNKGPRKNRSLSPIRGETNTPHTNEKRHKKVKSWAGSLIKLKPFHHHHHHHHRHNSVDEQQTQQQKPSESEDVPKPTPDLTLHSSSYVVPDPHKPAVDEQPIEPVIDLDAALGDATTGHRRSESAPENNGLRAGLLKPKGSDSILEEEEEEDEEELTRPPQRRNSNNPLTSQSAASSSLSVNSTASSNNNSSSSTRGRSYYNPRSYNPNILALDLLKQQKEQQSDEGGEAEQEEGGASGNDNNTRQFFGDEDNSNNNNNDKTTNRLSTITVSTGTITPGDYYYDQGDMGPACPLGEPGPQVRSFSVSEGTQMPTPTLPPQPRNSNNTRQQKRNSLILRGFHVHNSSCDYNGNVDNWDTFSRQSKRRSLRNKMVGWFKGRRGGGGSNTVLQKNENES